MRKPVDPTGFEQLLGDRQEKLPEQKDKERVSQKRRQNDCPERIVKPKLADQNKPRNHRHMPRQQHRSYHQSKHPLLATPLNARQPISHQRTRQRRSNHAANTQDHRIGQISQKRHALKCRRIIRPLEIFRHNRIRITNQFFNRLKRTTHHHQERKRKDR